MYNYGDPRYECDLLNSPTLPRTSSRYVIKPRQVSKTSSIRLLTTTKTVQLTSIIWLSVALLCFTLRLFSRSCVNFSSSLLYFRFCSWTRKTTSILVAEWPKAPASFFCACSCKSPGFESSHGAHRQATLVVGGCFEHRPQHPYLTCSVWAKSVHYMSIGVANE